MEETKTPKKPKKPLLWTAGLVLALIAAVTAYFTVLAMVQCRYTIIDGKNISYRTSTSRDTAQVLEEAEISTGPQDQVSESKTSRNTVTILIDRCMHITVEYQNQTLTADVYEGTVADILSQLDISLKDDEQPMAYGAALPLTEAVYDGLVIHIVSDGDGTYTETVAIPYETVTYLDPTLEAGDSQVKIPGVEGVREITYAVESAEVMAIRQLRAPVDEVILVGSAENSPTEAESAIEIATPTPMPTPAPTPEPTQIPSPTPEPTPAPTPAPTPEPAPPAPAGDTITTDSGTVLRYSQKLTMEATAYTGGGTTATGTSARYGAIAVDPKVIPYGTRMYIVSSDGKWVYGEATAEDCGGAVKGNIIDLYFNDYNTCIQFGRRNCTVYILE